jgi:hypothetical protein
LVGYPGFLARQGRQGREITGLQQGHDLLPESTASSQGLHG